MSDNFREDLRLTTTIEGLSPQELKKILEDLRNEDRWYAPEGKINTEQIGEGLYRQVDTTQPIPMITIARVEVLTLPNGKIDVVLHGEHSISGKIFGYEFHYQLEVSENGTLVVGLVQIKGFLGLKPFRGIVIKVYEKLLIEAFERLKQTAEGGGFDDVLFASEG